MPNAQQRFAFLCRVPQFCWVKHPISPVKHRRYMRYVCGAQKEDISGYAMLHKVRRDRCSLVIYHTRISLSATFRAFTKLLWAAFINWGAVDHETRFELLWRALSSLSLLLSARLYTAVQNGLNPPKISSPELISWIFSSKFQQVHIIFVSSHNIIFRNVSN